MQIGIIIPNYNGKKVLIECLKSLQKQTFTDFSVTVVDNGSTDGSLEILQNQFPFVKVISWPENRGFSPAVNEGILSSDTPLVFLLNNDTEVDANCLFELFKAANENQEYDFFAAKLYNYDDRSRLDGAGDGYLRGGVGYRLGTMERDGDHYRSSRQVFGACGGAALYRRSFFDQVGMFDDDFFAYLEDVDVNLRANCRHKKCWFVANAKVYHIGSATTGSKVNPFTVRLSTRNNLNVLVKNYPLQIFLRYLPVICLYQFFWLLFVIKKGQFVAYVKGLIGFFANLPRMLRKRRENLRETTADVNEIAELICAAEKEVIYSIMKRREENGKDNKLFNCYLKLFL
ncbi:MAG: glycosyltransferase family 2 protein [Bacteroidetes bacterium]|nr:glycosyltransferase family 2 protein [Bacteroidota bacterium]